MSNNIIYQPTGPRGNWGPVAANVTPVPAAAVNATTGLINRNALTRNWGQGHKVWALTKNNYSDADLKRLNELVGIKISTVGKEVAPTTGTPHLQIALTWSNAKRFSAMVKMFPGYHIELAKSPDTLHNYCTKDNDYTRIDNSKGRGHRSDIDTFKECANAGRSTVYMWTNHPEIMRAHYQAYANALLNLTPARHDVFTRGLYIHGLHGLGKSAWVKLAFGASAQFCELNSGFYSGRITEKILVFDDQDFTQMKSSYVKKLLNHTAYNANVKGSHANVNPDLIVIISNYPISETGWDNAAQSRFSGNRGATVEFTTPITNGFGRVPVTMPAMYCGLGPQPNEPFPVPRSNNATFADRLMASIKAATTPVVPVVQADMFAVPTPTPVAADPVDEIDLLFSDDDLDPLDEMSQFDFDQPASKRSVASPIKLVRQRNMLPSHVDYCDDECDQCGVPTPRTQLKEIVESSSMHLLNIDTEFPPFLCKKCYKTYTRAYSMRMSGTDWAGTSLASWVKDWFVVKNPSETKRPCAFIEHEAPEKKSKKSQLGCFNPDL